MKRKGKQNSQNGNIKIRYPIYPKGSDFHCFIRLFLNY